ncbi:hypothetical protein BU24DRAFT_411027 [Aaosphaeria arxii CBS 175.79]|uniref:Uncharacterized protein n=1 Tax=Aaosphaeria arxii CBS 175.79 TaxID=1450172 RepID=A0A6A5XJY4_9PLEO|nr:uncharacterized protein BU24DRAFT_411027 [Aaosphaeria arxii CBS 175.79]KAF2013263.1 hypothetical protein BU24DRAFT_411027 [Aaosphaeria arxii CBS 175.79]
MWFMPLRWNTIRWNITRWNTRAMPPASKKLLSYDDVDSKTYNRLIGFKKLPPLKGAKPPPKSAKPPPKSEKREVEKRATLFEEPQLRLLKEICDAIVTRLRPRDFVLFVGNSGSYMNYCFNHPRMGAIPMSKARRYEQFSDRENDPEGYGKLPGNDWGTKGAHLTEYYARYLRPKFLVTQEDDSHQVADGLIINRFLLVDHSTSGRSVDATKLLIDHVFHFAKRYKGRFAELEARNYDAVPFSIFNVLDKKDTVRIGGHRGAKFSLKAPKTVKLIGDFWVGSKGDVNRILGDGDHHYRNQVDYWPARWNADTGYWWMLEPEKKQQAVEIRAQIKKYVRDHNGGRLMAPENLNKGNE